MSKTFAPTDARYAPAFDHVANEVKAHGLMARGTVIRAAFDYVSFDVLDDLSEDEFVGLWDALDVHARATASVAR